MGLSPVSGPVWTAQGLEPVPDSVSPSLLAPALLALCLSLSKINKHNFFFKVPLSLLGKKVETHPEGIKGIALTTLPG